MSINVTTIYKFTYFRVYMYIYYPLISTEFNISVINAGNGDDSLDYHASAVDPTDGSTLRNIAFQLPNILNARIDNTAFWWVIHVYKCIHMFICIVFTCMCIHSFHIQCKE